MQELPSIYKSALQLADKQDEDEDEDEEDPPTMVRHMPIWFTR